MSNDEMPDEYTPKTPANLDRSKPTHTTFHVAIARKDSVLEGPWLYLRLMLDVNPQKCQGGLYANERNFMIVRTDCDGKMTVLYKWDAANQKWVKEKEVG